MFGTRDQFTTIRIEGNGTRRIILPRGITIDEPKVCAMCNKVFTPGEPEYTWLEHEFCSSGCMEEFIQITTA
jgi:hypothetical protein